MGSFYQLAGDSIVIVIDWARKSSTTQDTHMKRKVVTQMFDANGGFMGDPLATHRDELQLLMVQLLGHAMEDTCLLELSDEVYEDLVIHGRATRTALTRDRDNAVGAQQSGMQ